MPRPSNNIKGEKFNSLTVIRQTLRPKNTKIYGAWWIVHCNRCGQQSAMSADRIRKAKDCGCKTREEKATFKKHRAFLQKHFKNNGPEWCAEKLGINKSSVYHMTRKMGLKIDPETLKKLRSKHGKKSAKTRKDANNNKHIKLPETPSGHKALANTPRIKHWGVLEKPMNHGTWYR